MLILSTSRDLLYFEEMFWLLSWLKTVFQHSQLKRVIHTHFIKKSCKIFRGGSRSPCPLCFALQWHKIFNFCQNCGPRHSPNISFYFESPRFWNFSPDARPLLLISPQWWAANGQTIVHPSSGEKGGSHPWLPNGMRGGSGEIDAVIWNTRGCTRE